MTDMKLTIKAIAAQFNLSIEEMAIKLDKNGNVKEYIEEKKKEEEKEPETKICPYCLTEIKYHATRCPNCTSELVDEKIEA